MNLVYRPWVPREGMSGWFRHLSKAWRDPNHPRNAWPASILDKVCERGEPIPWSCDRDILPTRYRQGSGTGCGTSSTAI